MGNTMWPAKRCEGTTPSPAQQHLTAHRPRAQVSPPVLMHIATHIWAWAEQTQQPALHTNSLQPRGQLAKSHLCSSSESLPASASLS